MKSESSATAELHRFKCRRRALRLAAAIGCSAATVSSPTIAATSISPAKVSEPIVLKLHHFLPPKAFPQTRFLEPWAAKVEKESKGRIKVQLFPSMQLGGKPQDLVDQVRDGTVDMVWTVPSFSAGRFAAIETFELPFVAGDAVSTNLALLDYQQAHLGATLEDFHVILLHTNDGISLHANRPVRRLEDYAGLKIRVPNRAGAVYMTAVGAVPIGAPVNEVPQMLVSGAVDGALLSYEIAVPLRTHELVHFDSDFDGAHSRIMSPVFLFAMNKQRYAALPADLKAVIDANSGAQIAPEAGRTWIEIESEGREVSRRSGNTLIRIATGEVDRIREAVAPAIDKYLAQASQQGLPARALYDDARRLVAQYSAVRQ